MLLSDNLVKMRLEFYAFYIVFANCLVYSTTYHVINSTDSRAPDLSDITQTECDDLRLQLEILRQEIETNLTLIGDILFDQNNQITQQTQNLVVLRTEFNELKLNVSNIELPNKTRPCEDSWEVFQDTKCFQVVRDRQSIEMAKQQCLQLDASATLVSILSVSEQDFLKQLLVSYDNEYDSAWIGLERKNGSYRWPDGTPLGNGFSNWDDNADAEEQCVNFSLGKASLGKWKDESCRKKYLIVCQKKQTSQTVIQQELEKLTDIVEKHGKELDRHESEIESIKESLNVTKITK